MSESQPLHIEGDKTLGATATGNPIASSLNVLVSIPEVIEIKMVDASTLSDYEVWFFISSILASAVVGFLVATIQGFSSGPVIRNIFIGVTVIFFLLFVISICMTFSKRNKLRHKARQIKLKVGEAIAD